MQEQSAQDTQMGAFNRSEATKNVRLAHERVPALKRDRVVAQRMANPQAIKPFHGWSPRAEDEVATFLFQYVPMKSFLPISTPLCRSRSYAVVTWKKNCGSPYASR